MRRKKTRGRRESGEHRDGYYTHYESEELLAITETHLGSVRRYGRVCRELGTILQRVKHWRCTEEAVAAGYAAVDASYRLLKLADKLGALKERLDQEFTEDHAPREPQI